MSTSRTTNPLTVTAPEGLPFIDFTREFDAPVTAVFEAHRDPDLFRQWMSGDGFEMEQAPAATESRADLPWAPPY